MNQPERPVELTGRDAAVVGLIARFKMASSRQVHELLFPDRSFTPADRCLRRLVRLGFLQRIERRAVGGSRGGSGQYVYGLGRRGYVMMFGPGNYSPRRSVDYHALAILDSFISLKRLERLGIAGLGPRVRMVGYSTEPDCWVTVSGDELKPDLYVDIEAPGVAWYGRRLLPGEILKLWFEIDMGTEYQRHIREKLLRYVRVYNNAHWDEFPLVLWVAVDVERAKELTWLIKQHVREDWRGLFRVTTLMQFPTLFTSGPVDN